MQKLIVLDAFQNSPGVMSLSEINPWQLFQFVQFRAVITNHDAQCAAFQHSFVVTGIAGDQQLLGCEAPLVQ